MRADFGDIPCSDCGDEEKGRVFIKHWGPLVPPGMVGWFGPNCWAARMLLDREKARPLGTLYEHREYLMDDWSLMTFGRKEMLECGEDKEKLRELLNKVSPAKERFATSRQMFEEASRLRDIERDIQVRLNA